MKELWIKKNIKETIIKFGDTEIENQKFHQHKRSKI